MFFGVFFCLFVQFSLDEMLKYNNEMKKSNGNKKKKEEDENLWGAPHAGDRTCLHSEIFASWSLIIVLLMNKVNRVNPTTKQRIAAP